MRGGPTRTGLGLLLVVVSLTGVAAPVEAYVGPGAGFALFSSFLVFFTTILVVFLLFLVWPFRAAFYKIKTRNRPKPLKKRFIVVGFDGQDPQITERLMAQGKLPNHSRLAEMGCYHALESTCPSVSPVAWSTFATGVNPGKHNVFDFIDRDPRSYYPRLASTEIGSVDKYFKLGKYRIPMEKPVLRLLRKSKPFWSILGSHRHWSTILRVPITFPPEKFYGAQLSAMCVPDLLGTQGTFMLFTTREDGKRYKEGGKRITLSGSGDVFKTALEGPENLFLADQPPLAVPMTLTLDRAKQRVRVKLGKEQRDLALQELSDWITVEFSAAPGVKVKGICRMQVVEMDTEFSLYVTPLNIDPGKPAMPISEPGYYSTYLSKRIGNFCTLGLAEDTWALNEGVTTDDTFLQQSYDIDRERQDMFFASLSDLKEGSLVCVFDAADRIQHMFWRYTEPGHPAAKGIDNPRHADAIEKIYIHNDGIVGKVLDRIGKDDVLMVLSDHGMTSFRRGVNLNRWLRDNGYLFLKPGKEGSEDWLVDVDWSRTRAYVVGLSGLYLNLKGRESQGIVEPGDEARALKQELMKKLRGYKDPETGDVAINELFDTQVIYNGPYTRNAPDFIVGYNSGYRVSWDCATGVVDAPTFEDNVKAWSGDHIVDPSLVPGIFFCNYPIARSNPSLLDIAPTALQVFGLPTPAHMEGSALFAPAVLNPKARPGGSTTPVETKSDIAASAARSET